MAGSKATGAPQNLKILILEDNPADKEIIEYELQQAGFVFISRHVENKESYLKTLKDFRPDMILSDYDLPSFTGWEALQIRKERCPETPFILVTGAVGEERAIEVLTGGATDYVLKRNLSKLPPAVQRALHETYEHRKRREAEAERDRLFREMERRVEERTAELAAGVQDRRKAEEALHESENRYRELVENANSIIIRMDRSGKIDFFNEYAQRFFGYSPEEILGQNVKRLLPEVESGSGRNLNEMADTILRDPDDAVDNINESIRKDGERVWVSWRNKAIRAADGSIAGNLAVGQDITERKRAEAALRASEERFNAFMNNGPVIAWMKDELGRHVYLSKTYEDRFGVKRGDWLGKTDDDVWPAEIAREFRTNDHEVLATGQPMAIEETTPGPDGGLTHWMNIKFPFHDASGRRHVGGIGLDITDRRRMEKELRAREAEIQFIADATPIVLTRCSRDLRYLFVNRACAELLRLPAEEIIGKPIVDILGKDAFETIRPYIERVLSGETVDYEAEIPYQGAGRRSIHVSYVPEKNGQGEITGWIASIQDVTERKRAEAALRASEELLQAAIAGSQGAEWQVPADEMQEHGFGDAAYLSQQCKRFIGFADNEFPNSVSAWRERIHPEDLPAITTAARSHIEEQSPFYNVEYRIRHRDGTWRYLSSTGRLHRDSNGRPLRWSGLDWDVTEQKRVETALHQSERRLEIATGETGIGIFESSSISRDVLGNEQFGRLTGLSPRPAATTAAAFQRYYRDEWAERVHPDDWPGLQAKIDECQSQRGPLDAEYRISGIDGIERWVNVRGVFPDGDQGNAERFLGVLIDITERKRAQERLAVAHRQMQDIIDNTTSLVYAFDLEERFLLANAAVAKLFNSTPEQMIGKRRHEFMPREDADGHEANDRRVIEAGKALEYEEYSQLQGRAITWLTTKFPLRDAQGKIYAVGGFSAEITERKRAEEGLKDRTVELESVIRELESFTYSVSHDLRAPLRAISGFLDILMKTVDEKLDSEERRRFQVVRDNAMKMNQLIDSLLVLSRVGRFELTLRTVDMKRLAELVWDQLLQSDPGTPYLRIGDLPDAVGDSGLLSQVFSNLIGNACKFTRTRRKPEIEIGGESDGNESIYYVKDNGVGFSMKQYNRLFGVFQRLHRESEFEGTGVGLAIVQRIIHRHGGRVWADGKPGKGSTFFFSLPAGDKSKPVI